MQKYVEYLGSIAVDAALHEKIMNRLARKTPSLRAVCRYAGLAACAAALMLCVWAARAAPDSAGGTGDPTAARTTLNASLAVDDPAQTPGPAVEIRANEIEKPEPAVMGMFALMGEDFVEMTYDEITAYFGVALPVEQALPALRRQAKPEGYLYGVWDGGGYTASAQARGVYFDANCFLFSDSDGTRSLWIGLDKVFHYPAYNFIEALADVDELAFSKINNRELAVFHFADAGSDCYYVEFVQGGVCYCVSAVNLSEADFAKCLAALIAEAEPVANPRTATGTACAIDSYACYIGLKTDDGLSYGVHLPPGEAEKYSLYQKIEIVFNGEPATIGEIWQQQLVSIRALD